jgi:hypothetical protein
MSLSKKNDLLRDFAAGVSSVLGSLRPLTPIYTEKEEEVGRAKMQREG